MGNSVSDIPSVLGQVRSLESDGVVLRISWSPDGRFLAIPCRPDAGRRESGSLLLWDMAAESFRPLDICNVAKVAWAPDSRAFAVGAAYHDKLIRIIDLESGEVRQRMEEASGWLIDFTWSPIGNLLASGSWNGTIQIWDSSTGLAQRWFAAHAKGVNSIAWSPDGSLLASASEDKTLRLSQIEGTAVATLRGHRSSFQIVAWSKDGSMIATGSRGGTIRIWSASARRETNLLQGHTGAVTSVSFSVDGRLLASKSEDGTVRLWRTDRWETVAVIPETGSAEWRAGVSFHPHLPRLAAPGRDGRGIQIWDHERPVISPTTEVGYDSHVEIYPDRFL
jgi:WD40 repeat protein